MSSGPTIVRQEVNVTGNTTYTTYSDNTEVVRSNLDNGNWYETVKYADGTSVTTTNGIRYGTGESDDDYIRRMNAAQTPGGDEILRKTQGPDGPKTSVVTEWTVNADGSEVQKGIRINPDGTQTEFVTRIDKGAHYATDGSAEGNAPSVAKDGSAKGSSPSITVDADGNVTSTSGVEVWGDTSKITTTPGGTTTVNTSSGVDNLYYLINNDKTTITKEKNDEGYTKYIVTTDDGETHTIDFGTEGGTQSWYSVVKDENGNDKLLGHRITKSVDQEEVYTDLGYEWAVQNFTDETSPYYGRSVTRTLPIPQATEGGTDKGGLLRYGQGVFEEVFVNYGEHLMTVTHYFNVDVYRVEVTESCDTNENGDESCDPEYEYIYEYSYIKKDPPQYYEFRVPLICLDCVPPAPGVRVCIGGGCDCVGDEFIVCDIQHSTEKDLQIENRIELER